MEELTENEKYVLAEIERKFGTKWFSSIDLSQNVSRSLSKTVPLPGLHCISLIEKGYLETRLHESFMYNMYRIRQEN